MFEQEIERFLNEAKEAAQVLGSALKHPLLYVGYEVGAQTIEQNRPLAAHSIQPIAAVFYLLLTPLSRAFIQRLHHYVVFWLGVQRAHTGWHTTKHVMLVESEFAPETFTKGHFLLQSNGAMPFSCRLCSMQWDTPGRVAQFVKHIEREVDLRVRVEEIARQIDLESVAAALAQKLEKRYLQYCQQGLVHKVLYLSEKFMEKSDAREVASSRGVIIHREPYCDVLFSIFVYPSHACDDNHPLFWKVKGKISIHEKGRIYANAEVVCGIVPNGWVLREKAYSSPSEVQRALLAFLERCADDKAYLTKMQNLQRALTDVGQWATERDIAFTITRALAYCAQRLWEQFLAQRLLRPACIQVNCLLLQTNEYTVSQHQAQYKVQFLPVTATLEAHFHGAQSLYLPSVYAKLEIARRLRKRAPELRLIKCDVEVVFEGTGYTVVLWDYKQNIEGAPRVDGESHLRDTIAQLCDQFATQLPLRTDVQQRVDESLQRLRYLRERR